MNMVAVRDLMNPGVAFLVSRAVPGHIFFRWDTQVDFATEDILFACIVGPHGVRKKMTFITVNEVLNDVYKREALPRLESWIKKNIPKPHIRYIPHWRIKRPRHPSE